jgi:dUTP pyrophosphatase
MSKRTLSDEKLPGLSQVLVKFHSEHAKLPTRGSARAAGYDLYSAEKVVIPPNGKTVVIQTGISIEIKAETDDYHAEMRERSSMAMENIRLGGGTVDSDFRGPLKVMLYNTGDKEYIIEIGHRIAQLIFLRYLQVEMVNVDQLSETERGDKGFGSTGL